MIEPHMTKNPQQKMLAELTPNFLLNNKSQRELFAGLKLVNPFYCSNHEIKQEEKLNLNGVKILILGHAGHGKDTFAEMLREASGNILTSCSSSWFMTEYVLGKFEKCAAQPNFSPYKTKEECYNDRYNHRSFWFECIADYNKEHGMAHLGKELTRCYNIYTGMRNPHEYVACIKENVFDVIFYVDASDRVPLEDKSSNQMNFSHEMFAVDNQSNLENLKQQAENIIEGLFKTTN